MDIKLLVLGAQLGLICFFLGYLGWQLANYRFLQELRKLQRDHLNLREQIERGQNDS